MMVVRRYKVRVFRTLADYSANVNEVDTRVVAALSAEHAQQQVYDFYTEQRMTKFGWVFEPTVE